MCGIFSVFLKSDKRDTLLREKSFQYSRRQRHRGPDSTGVECGDQFCIVQERLSIIGVATGKQPLLSDDHNIILAANGEIYNYKELTELISTRRGMAYNPRSDSDVIMAMYEEFGMDCVSMLWGMFGFVLYDKARGHLFVARDGLGVCSLYYGEGNDCLYIASEMKCIPCEKVYTFPPGAYLAGTADKYEFTEYYKPMWSNLTSLPADLAELKRRLFVSVEYHLASEVPLACFLSGGLNSSIIALLAQQVLQSKLGPDARLRTFVIGMKDSDDLYYARMVANHLGTDHTEISFTADQGIDLIHELVWHLETYDPGCIRSAVPMFILSRAVRSAGVKCIISGEGADDIFGGFSYYHNAPSVEDFGQETVRRLLEVHLSDGLRANKTSMAQSVELRAPYLGSPFVNYAMTIRPEDRMPLPRDHQLESLTAEELLDAASSPQRSGSRGRGGESIVSSPRAVTRKPSKGSEAPSSPRAVVRKPSKGSEPVEEDQKSLTPRTRAAQVCCKCDQPVEDINTVASTGTPAQSSSDDAVKIEKWLLRRAFEDDLPPEIIWRQKATFCEGVGEEWVTALENYANDRISDAQFERRHELYPHNTPENKEEFLYRQIFDLEYPGEARAKTVIMWKPSWSPSCTRINSFDDGQAKQQQQQQQQQQQ